MYRKADLPSPAEAVLCQTGTFLRVEAAEADEGCRVSSSLLLRPASLQGVAGEGARLVGALGAGVRGQAGAGRPP